jgi:arylsulfatase A-like enzyme
MTDQHRAEWMSCAGTDYVDTPNIDFIAERGLRFTRASCTSPLCAPSRCSLAGGVYPHRLGVMENARNFPAGHPTYYQKLREAGYRVGVVGKTDLHKADHFLGANGDLPIMYHLGFTDAHQTEGKMNAAMPKQHLSRFDLDNFELAGPYQAYLQQKGALERFVLDYKKRSGLPVSYAEPSALDSGDFHDSYIGMKACEFLEQVSEESPWHYFVSFVGPHDPWDAPAEYVKRFEDREYPESIADSLEGKPHWVQKKAAKHGKGLTDEQLNRVKQHYAGAIKLLDDWIGRILDVLKRRGQLDNTVIMFCADHGEMLGDHGLLQKQVMYEGALRVPLIVSAPGQMRFGATDTLVELVDLYPTILQLAGAPCDESALDGKSFAPIIYGEKETHKAYQISELQHTSMIFDGKYKLIHSVNDSSELYDLESDPQELRNVYETSPDVVGRLNKQLKQLLK